MKIKKIPLNRAFLALFLTFLLGVKILPNPEMLADAVEALADWSVYYDANDGLYTYHMGTEEESKIIDKSENIYSERFVLKGNYLIGTKANAHILSDSNTSFFIETLPEQKRVDLPFHIHQVINFLTSNDGRMLAIAGREKNDEKKEPHIDGTLGKLKWPDVNLYLVDLKGDNHLQMYVEGNVAQISSWQAWSPDNSKLLFETTEGDLVLFDLNEKKSILLEEKAGNASWSPDGREILYQRNPREEVPGNYYLFNFATKERKVFFANVDMQIDYLRFRNTYAFNRPGIWSPDGQSVFLSRHVTSFWGASYEIAYLLNVELRKLNRLGKINSYAGVDILPEEWSRATKNLS